ncbi:MAG: methionine synthase [Deltaproteobacteria bacterium]|nr:methionine synthase [Deltaproteobacteria bacterium]
MKSDFLKRLQEKILVFDGPKGTGFQQRNLTADDFDGLDGCNEYLCQTRPDVVKEVHASYLEVGSDAIITNSFGSATYVLDEYGIGDKAFDLSKKSAQIAKEVANDFASKSWPRFVSGSIGPTTKLPTLGHISFDAMVEAYLPNMMGLLEGGIDLFSIETCQDILQVKSAVVAARKAMHKVGRQVPICVQFTVETTGTMLVGTEVPAVLTVCETLPIDIVGMNCATGPDLMQEHVRFLGKTSTHPISVLPNAGLPRNVNGQIVYDLDPESFAEQMEVFVKDYGVSIVGGCCGTTPQHLEALYDKVGGLNPQVRMPDYPSHVSSLYSAVALDQDGTSPLIIGERCNANGSKKFKQLLDAEDWEEIVEMGRAEVREGSHVIDICTAFVGRNEESDMLEVLSRFSTQVTAPVMIDTTQLDVLEAALKVVGGRPIINSINLEDGEEKFDRICQLAVDYGAALIALTIDEDGMAKQAEKKLEIAQRIHDRATEKFGIPSEAIIYDPLTFTIGSGDEDSRKAAIETLNGISLIKKHIPKSRTVLGVSNVSFGLKPYPRQVLNSVFLAEAIKAGLDACIVHARKIMPIHKIEAEISKICLDLIYDKRAEGYDPLFKLIEKLQGAKASVYDQEEIDSGTVEEVLKRRIIDGRKPEIEKHLDKALKKYSAVEIINKILLDGMRTVGELFGSGEMQLPFVLKSAETMKTAVSYLEQYMDKLDSQDKGTLVIATVKGDVHDIGKNLVDIILSNNGYKVVNLGIKQPLENILSAVQEHSPQAVGMSGLLVKSTVIMKENLEQMSEKQIKVPVICGGAALNRAYVEVDLRQAYKTGDVYYGADAFTGLQIMEELTGQTEELKLTIAPDSERVRKGEMRVEREERIREKSQEYVRSDIKQLESVPKPPFWGVKYVMEDQLDLTKIFPYVNRKALYANQWMYRRGKRSSVDYRHFLKTHVDPLFNTWCKRALENKWLTPRVVYGYFPCQSERNELIIYDPEDPTIERARFNFPRQVADKRRCISDFFLSKDSGRMDVVGFHIVTIGELATEKCQELFAADAYTDYLHFYGLSVETAEALAEYWHKVIRAELGISSQDGKTIDMLFRQTYRGSRYSFGYPACPDLEKQKPLFELLKPEKIGVSLSSECQLVPEQSTSAIIVHHPDAYYFSV